MTLTASDINFIRYISSVYLEFPDLSGYHYPPHVSLLGYMAHGRKLETISLNTMEQVLMRSKHIIREVT